MGDNKSFAQTLLDLIPSGEENAITARELASLLNVHWRIVTLTIHLLRCSKKRLIVICGSGKGYFLPANNAELEHFVRQMRSRVKHIRAATRSAERLLKLGGVDDERR